MLRAKSPGSVSVFPHIRNIGIDIADDMGFLSVTIGAGEHITVFPAVSLVQCAFDQFALTVVYISVGMAVSGDQAFGIECIDDCILSRRSADLSHRDDTGRRIGIGNDKCVGI